MSPATAGPARSAERTMLASILGVLIDIDGLGARFEEDIGFGCYGRQTAVYWDGRCDSRNCIYNIFDHFESTMIGLSAPCWHYKGKLISWCGTTKQSKNSPSCQRKRTMPAGSEQASQSERLYSMAMVIATPVTHIVASAIGVVSTFSLSTTKAMQSINFATNGP